jgi:hypothetical protein
MVGLTQDPLNRNLFLGRSKVSNMSNAPSKSLQPAHNISLHRIARIGEIYDRENELIIEQESAREVRQVAASGVHQP